MVRMAFLPKAEIAAQLTPPDLDEFVHLFIVDSACFEDVVIEFAPDRRARFKSWRVAIPAVLERLTSIITAALSLVIIESQKSAEDRKQAA